MRLLGEKSHEITHTRDIIRGVVNAGDLQETAANWSVIVELKSAHHRWADDLHERWILTANP